jgi:CDP-glycerol glycerophosphotransferase (TagB/SpsB family)
MLFTALKNPRRAKKVRAALQKDYISSHALKNTRYVFFPLHTEPEVSLLVYGRPFVNQIEVIRMLAMSLPVDMVLVVKEHPWMVGKRSMGAYKKILNIPRVLFADPKLDARTLIQESDMVTVITGSVALEAAMIGKPVITFGDCPYNILPDAMVRRCDDLRHIQILLREMLDEYECDDQALEHYVEAVFETSASVNLYSVLLEKKNVHSEKSSSYFDEAKKLAEYMEAFLLTKRVTDSEGLNSAQW